MTGKANTKPVALVSGCGQQLNVAICQRLARDGFAAAANLETSPAGTPDWRDGVHVVAGSPRDGDSAQSIVDETRAALGPVDVLTFGAAFGKDAKFVNSDAAEWWRHINENLSAGFYLAHEVVREMKAKGQGRIIFIMPLDGAVGRDGATAICAASAGLMTLTKTLGRELAPHGVLVNGVAVSGIAATEYAVNDESFRSLYGVHQDSSRYAGRWCGLDDVAATVSFLAGDRGSGFVGQILQLNGGRFRGLA
jgi:NAD(P)-dependent dehydrogenase (short-subunit alcohol dehydrogenase family)